eukprot:403350197
MTQLLIQVRKQDAARIKALSQQQQQLDETAQLDQQPQDFEEEQLTEGITPSQIQEQIRQDLEVPLSTEMVYFQEQDSLPNQEEYDYILRFLSPDLLTIFTETFSPHGMHVKLLFDKKRLRYREIEVDFTERHSEMRESLNKIAKSLSLEGQEPHEVYDCLVFLGNNFLGSKKHIDKLHEMGELDQLVEKHDLKQAKREEKISK